MKLNAINASDMGTDSSLSPFSQLIKSCEESWGRIHLGLAERYENVVHWIIMQVTHITCEVLTFSECLECFTESWEQIHPGLAKSQENETHFADRGKRDKEDSIFPVILCFAQGYMNRVRQ